MGFSFWVVVFYLIFDIFYFAQFRPASRVLRQSDNFQCFLLLVELIILYLNEYYKNEKIKKKTFIIAFGSSFDLRFFFCLFSFHFQYTYDKWILKADFIYAMQNVCTTFVCTAHSVLAQVMVFVLCSPL